jgi:hypothetical protein
MILVGFVCKLAFEQIACTLPHHDLVQRSIKSIAAYCMHRLIGRMQCRVMLLLISLANACGD